MPYFVTNTIYKKIVNSKWSRNFVFNSKRTLKFKEGFNFDEELVNLSTGFMYKLVATINQPSQRHYTQYLTFYSTKMCNLMAGGIMME